MRLPIALAHEFVEFIPEEIRPGIVFVCIQYATVVHKCCCGCGHEVVTPLSPTDWKLTFDGVSISLHPSIGNWGFPCQSHYWIRHNRVHWAGCWTRAEIEAGRDADAAAKAEYYHEDVVIPIDPLPAAVEAKPGVVVAAKPAKTVPPKVSWWRRLLG